MDIERQRSLRRRRGLAGVNDRVAFGLEQRYCEPTLLEHRGQQLCVLPDVGAIRGEVWQRDQLHQFGEDLLLVLRPPFTDAKHFRGWSRQH